MKRLLMLATLCMALSMAIAPAAMAQNLYNCSSFQSQAQAQAVLNQNPSDPNHLDANHNGVACEDYNYGTQATTTMQGSTMMGSSMMQSSGMMQTTAMQTTAAAPMQPATTAPSSGTSTAPMTALPNSGGPALLLPVGALVLGTGLLTVGIVRRR